MMGELVVDVAAIVGGLTIIGASAWRWVLQPAFVKVVREVVQAENAAALQPIMDELSFNSGKSVKDVVIRIDARLGDHLAFHQKAS